jgi:asparagine synthase (glutamine-hydrolysing)
MPGSILVLWPVDSAIDIEAHASCAQRFASDRGPIRLLIAGGEEPVSVADARLDNAIELKSALGLPTTASDGRVIDEAFGLWGSRVPERLAGDFVWARWDPSARELMLVRDHMGIRPLVYARYRDGFAAATDIRAIRSLPGVDLRWDDLYVAMSLTDVWLDRSSTFHAGIKRLAPGTMARVREQGKLVAITDHWALPTEDIRFPRESDYTERFRELFLEAVRCRVATGGAVATELSGGLDSTVVTAATAQLAQPPLLALAASFDDERYESGRHDEGRHRAWARTDPALALLELPATRMITEDAVERLMRTHGTPMAPVMDLVRLDLWTEAAARGRTTVLDGFDGDTTVNYGFERLMQLLRAGRLLTLGHETIAAHRRAGRRGLYEIAVLLGYSTFHAASGLVRYPRAIAGSLASRELLRRSGFLDLYESTPAARPGDVREEHRLDVRSGTIALAIERLDIVAAAAGVEVRHPFFDRRLVEYCIALPSRLLFHDRMPRWIQRAALAGLGPDQVLWRHDKGAMPSALGDEGLVALGAESAPLPPSLSHYVDLERTRTLRDRWAVTQDSAQTLYPVFELSRWLELENAGHQ